MRQRQGGYLMDTRQADAQERLCGGAHCAAAIGEVLAVVSGRWALSVLEALHFGGGSLRFGALQRAVGQVSHKELLRQLRRFGDAGVVRREETGARQVAYVLSEAGLALLAQLSTLRHWPARAASERLAPTRLDNWLKRPADEA